MIGLLCEGRSSDLPFLVRVFETLLACTRVPASTPFPLDTGRGWTKLTTQSGRLIGIRAAGSYEKVLDVLPAVVATAAASKGLTLGVVVDLDDHTMASREQAVRDKVRASGILNPPPVTVVGIGLQASLVQVSPSRNLDQVVTEIILSGQPPLTSVLSTLVGTIAALGQKPNWKLATCALAGALGKEHGEAIYHHTVAAFPNETKNVLSQAGTLQTLEAMIA